MAAGSFSLSITIPVTGGALNPDVVDRSVVVQMLAQASQAVGSGTVTSGNLVYNQSGTSPTTIGTWTYTAGT